MSDRWLVALLGALLSASFPASATAKAPDCTRRVDEFKAGRALSAAVALSPDRGSEQRLKNFDGNRGIEQIKNIRLVSDKRLPATLTPAKINFEALIERGEATLASADFPDPTFTEPRITPDRRHIVFTICLNAAGLGPGKYVGNVTVSGPEGLGEARVGITANLKARWYVWVLLALGAEALAFGGLYWKDSTKDPSPIDKSWWFKTAGTLLVTFGVLAAVFIKDPAWGANTFQAAIALAGTALASVGGRKLIE